MYSIRVYIDFFLPSLVGWLDASWFVLVSFPEIPVGHPPRPRHRPGELHGERPESWEADLPEGGDRACVGPPVQLGENTLP